MSSICEPEPEEKVVDFPFGEGRKKGADGTLINVMQELENSCRWKKPTMDP